MCASSIIMLLLALVLSCVLCVIVVWSGGSARVSRFTRFTGFEDAIATAPRRTAGQASTVVLVALLAKRELHFCVFKNFRFYLVHIYIFSSLVHHTFISLGN